MSEEQSVATETVSEGTTQEASTSLTDEGALIAESKKYRKRSQDAEARLAKLESQLAKDTSKLMSLNKRKHIQKEKMIDMIGDLNEQDFNMFEEKMNAFYTYIQLSK